MTNLRKIIAIGAIVLTLAATSLTAFAASKYSTPAEAVAGLTGKTVESVIAQKNETNKTYGTIANDAGKLEEFKKEVLDMKKDILAKRVADGTMTQAKADEILAALKENQATCDGTGSARIGQKFGAGFGGMNGGGQGAGRGMGRGACGGTCVTE